MATVANRASGRAMQERIPILRNGDRMSGAEFDRRYEAMPYLKKAELIDGRVYIPSPDFYVSEGFDLIMGSPVAFRGHSEPHLHASTWLGNYLGATPGVAGGDNGTVRLDLNNRPQPDLFLFIRPSHGGRVRISPDDYVEGAPDLIVEISNSSLSYDLHDKLEVYRRNDVREYVVWRVEESAIDWFVPGPRGYDRMAMLDGVYFSRVLPGLRLDAGAMIRGDIAAFLRVLSEGTASPEHAAFVADLAAESARTAQSALVHPGEPRP